MKETSLFFNHFLEFFNFLESLVFVLDPANATDTIPSIGGLESNFLTFAITGEPTEDDLVTDANAVLTGGADDFAAGTTPAVTIASADSKNVYYQDGFEIGTGNTYEINALFNGAAWIVAAVKINVE